MLAEQWQACKEEQRSPPEEHADHTWLTDPCSYI